MLSSQSGREKTSSKSKLNQDPNSADSSQQFSTLMMSSQSGREKTSSKPNLNKSDKSHHKTLQTDSGKNSPTDPSTPTRGHSPHRISVSSTDQQNRPRSNSHGSKHKTASNPHLLKTTDPDPQLSLSLNPTPNNSPRTKQTISQILPDTTTSQPVIPHLSLTQSPSNMLNNTTQSLCKSNSQSPDGKIDILSSLPSDTICYKGTVIKDFDDAFYQITYIENNNEQTVKIAKAIIDQNPDYILVTKNGIGFAIALTHIKTETVTNDISQKSTSQKIIPQDGTNPETNRRSIFIGIAVFTLFIVLAYKSNKLPNAFTKLLDAFFAQCNQFVPSGFSHT